jgi:predicted ATPase
VFLGGFDLDAAQAVAGGGELERYQVLDQLTLRVDKSLVVADDTGGRTRYRLLETVRQYALEKLGESGEADGVRARHRNHYTSMAAPLDAPASTDYKQRVEQANIEIDTCFTFRPAQRGGAPGMGGNPGVANLLAVIAGQTRCRRKYMTLGCIRATATSLLWNM